MGIVTPQGARIREMTPEERKQYDRETGATHAWVKFNVLFWGSVFTLWATCVIWNAVH